MNDNTISNRIERLVDEEHALRRREQLDSTDERALTDDPERLLELEIELDRCWDLLRQRRARRDAGEDPDAAQVRSAATVESYLQ